MSRERREVAVAAARVEQDRAPVLVTVFVIGGPRMRQVPVGDDVDRDLDGFAGEGSGHRDEQEGGDPDGRPHRPIIVGGVSAVKWRRLESVPGCGGGARRCSARPVSQYTTTSAPHVSSRCATAGPHERPRMGSR